MSDRALENEVIRLWQQQMPMRGIAKQLRISRYLVKRIIVDHQDGRAQGTPHPDLPKPPESRGSVLNIQLAFIQELLTRWPSIERRIPEARFREPVSLEGFDWAFNAQTIDRIQIEASATGEFIRRGDNLVIAGQCGVGKSRIVQSVGRAACSQGYRVRYTTSADLLRDLTASLADHTLPQQLRDYANFELLIIDEFGFDKIERAESGQAASLLYKVVDSRGPKRSTAMVTNISFEAWADYLGDAPLAGSSLKPLPRATEFLAELAYPSGRYTEPFGGGSGRLAAGKEHERRTRYCQHTVEALLGGVASAQQSTI